MAARWAFDGATVLGGGREASAPGTAAALRPSAAIKAMVRDTRAETTLSPGRAEDV